MAAAPAIITPANTDASGHITRPQRKENNEVFGPQNVFLHGLEACRYSISLEVFLTALQRKIKPSDVYETHDAACFFRTCGKA